MITSLSECKFSKEGTVFIEYEEFNRECSNTGSLINPCSTCKSYYLLNDLIHDKDKELYIGCDKRIGEYFDSKGVLKRLQEYYDHVKCHDYLTDVYDDIKCAKVEKHDKFGIYISFDLNINEGRLLYNICTHNRVSAVVLTDNHPISSNTIMLKPIGIVLSLGVINDISLII